MEELISQKKTIGLYIFDEEKKIFTSDVEITLGIKKLKDGLYKAEYYFFDGYETGLSEDFQLYFEGNENEAKEKAILSWNEDAEIFMGYPIIYTNIYCEIENV
ncbi:hypothetical protein AAG747_12825 [Rapidithrix thailandica]|uniref:Uncharacterized protein n=1 Tax=Rapidithrix thailandica TaxID=413964 RepID=A0AAW9S5P4_9BACT